MAIRFNKRVKIAPGLSLNFGKRGASVSVGTTGNKITFGSSGVRQTLGVPGTGLYSTRQLNSSSTDESAPPEPATRAHLSFRTVVLILTGAALLAFLRYGLP